MSRIFTAHVNEYDLNDITEALDRIFDGLMPGSWIKPGMRVVLKPNLLMKRTPEEATTTHPAVVEGVIIKLKNLGVTDIVIADSPGGPYTASALKGIYIVSGMAEVAKRQGVTLNFDTGYQKVAARGDRITSFNIINPLCDTDFIINLPKLKTHGMTGMSGAVKNMFGAVPGLMKPELHMRFPNKIDFADMLIDLFLTVGAHVSIVDAVVSMEGNGPSGGRPKKTGMLIGATDAFSLDAVLASIIGMGTENVEMLLRAKERKLFLPGTQMFGDELITYGDFKLSKTHSLDFTGFAGPLGVLCTPLTRMLSPRPKIKKSGCIGCGKCAESCPAKTIKIIDKNAIINYEKCIKCFCCHEMCPVKTIEIRRFKPFSF